MINKVKTCVSFDFNSFNNSADIKIMRLSISFGVEKER
jgi:hypothetical protein